MFAAYTLDLWLCLCLCICICLCIFICICHVNSSVGRGGRMNVCGLHFGSVAFSRLSGLGAVPGVYSLHSNGRGVTYNCWHRTQNTEHRTQNTERRTQCTAQNTQHTTHKHCAELNLIDTQLH